jgi:membrane protease YdiL (CAAX protease family)
MLTRRSVALIAGTLVLLEAFWLLDASNWRVFDSDALSGLAKLVIFGGGSMLAVCLASRVSPRQAVRSLGLDASFGRGLQFGVAATLPMALAASWRPASGLTWDAIAGAVVFGPLAEEILFRGLLFTQLRRSARWPLTPALAVSAAVFGLAHVPVLHPTILLAMQAVAAALAGVLFAWVCERFRSLWPAVALHALMNLWWTAARGDQARVAWHVDVAGLAQTATILLSISLALAAWPKLEKIPRAAGGAGLLDGVRAAPTPLSDLRTRGLPPIRPTDL